MAGPTTSIVMPDALIPIAVPNGWTIISERDPITMACPEADLTASFLARAYDDNIEQLLQATWRSISPEFDLLIKHKAEMPTANGWDKEITVLYDTPAKESRMVFSIVRLLASRSYIILIDGTKAAFSRRMAQIVELANGWKPAGLKEPSLLGVVPK